MISGKLVRIIAPHFVAGIISADGRIKHAAPILRWAIGSDTRSFRDWLARKGYRFEVLS